MNLSPARPIAPVSARCAALPLLALLLSATLTLPLGCRPPSASEPVGPSDPEGEIVKQRELFNQAIRSILEYPQYDDTEMFQQAVGRLDQWVQQQKPLDDWRVDPLVSALPQPFPRLVHDLQLDRLEFPTSDQHLFLEAAWLRDISIWARGDAVDELDQACRLFDWTVRNIQLDWDAAGQGPGSAGRLLQKPWETLLLGRGTATDRAWVFILLARQQGIDAALLAIADPQDATGQRMRPWVVAVLSQGQLYLFEPTLGLPIPASRQIDRPPSQPLDLRPATLAQVAADDALLRQLDIGEIRYPVESSQVQRAIALLEASPSYLAQRTKLVENRLTGDERFVLTTNPSAQAERFKACQHVADAQLWTMPYQTLAQQLQLGRSRDQWWVDQVTPFIVPTTGPQPGLWKGRQYHFKGIFTGKQSAAAYYQDARVPDRVIRQMDQQLRDQLKDLFGDNEQAIDKLVDMANAGQLDTATLQNSVRALGGGVATDLLRLSALARAKIHASYWLGLIAAEQGNSEPAIDWLATRTLQTTPNGPWTGGATYNLGRVYEANGQIAEAAKAYRSDTQSPALHGNVVRANWLQRQTTPKTPAQPPQQTEKPAPDKPADPAPEAAPKSSPDPGKPPRPEEAQQPADPPGQPPQGDSPESAQTAPEQT